MDSSVTKNRKRLTFLLFLIVYPIVFFLTYQSFTIRNNLISLDYLFFLFLGLAVAFFPIIIDGSLTFLINTVSIAVFLVYGVFAEMLLTMVAIIGLMIRIRAFDKEDHIRWPINLQMYQLLSLISAGAYYLLEPVIPVAGFYGYNLVAIFFYLITFLVSNQCILYVTDRLIFQRERHHIFRNSFKFSIISSSYTVPAVVILIYLYRNFDLSGIVIMGVPIIAISVTMSMYYKSKTMNEDLQKVNKLAQELTGHHSRKDVVQKFMESLPDLLPVDSISLYDLPNPAYPKLVLIRQFHKGKELQNMNRPFQAEGIGNTVVEKAWRNDETIHYNKASEWIHFMRGEVVYKAESVVALPVKREKRIVGVCMITNKKSRMYDENTVAVLEVLLNYFNIALDNAKHYEQLLLNSETDHLTGLPNLRAFEQTIQNYNLLNPDTPQALVVLDLDYFKQINDTYGHEAGNEMLRQFADMLRTFVEKDGDIARYGGEEFIVFLPDYSLDKALQFAEALRQIIEESTFVCHDYMRNNAEEIILTMTASIGVAAYPDQCEDPKNLIAQADRAMYLGSKRNGRNKVTAFSA